MTAPVGLPTDVGTLGPGTLKIGQTGTLIDVSCYVNNAAIEPTKNGGGDPIFKLCGNSRPASFTYSFQLTGNLDTDLGNESGLFELAWANPGVTVDFEFIPSTELARTFTGQVVLDPFRVGADNYGDMLTSDFALDCIGQPALAPVIP